MVWAEEEAAALLGLLVAVLVLLIVHLLLRICVSVSSLCRTSCCCGEDSTDRCRYCQERYSEDY